MKHDPLNTHDAFPSVTIFYGPTHLSASFRQNERCGELTVSGFVGAPAWALDALMGALPSMIRMAQEVESARAAWIAGQVTCGDLVAGATGGTGDPGPVG